MQRIESAIRFIDSDDRDTWLRMGMAIKSELGDAGFDLWDTWSQSSPSYRLDSSRAVWRSIHPAGGITIASLFHEAKGAGWRDDGTYPKPMPQEIVARKRRQETANQKRTAQGIREHAVAAQRAEWILGQCELDMHQYLAVKGWPHAVGNIWKRADKEPVLVIPMYHNGIICGCQLISPGGNKKFLTGQRCQGAEFVISAGGINIWCEGYATGIAIREAVAALKVIATIHICFSAGNLQRMAKSGIVVADNDASGTGERVALATGLPYYLPEMVGTDFNDEWKKRGLFFVSQRLKKVLTLAKK